jgi:capsular exopolysaccharide synthesis family protein
VALPEPLGEPRRSGGWGAQNQISRLARVVRRRWLVLAVALLGVPAAAVVYSLASQKQYSAKAALLFRETTFDQQLLGAPLFAPATDPGREAATNQTLVSLDAVNRRTARLLGMSPDELRSHLSATPVGQADVVDVVATFPDPRLAAHAANAFAATYVSYRRDVDARKIDVSLRELQRLIATTPPGTPESRRLSTRAERLRTLAALQTGNAEVAQVAGVPTKPSAPHTRRNVAAGIGLGILLAFALATLAEHVDRRVRDQEEIEEITGLPVVGAVPQSRFLASAQSSLGSRGAGAEVDAFRALRARLRLLAAGRERRLLSVTSPGEGDGKTTVALQLACAAAEIDAGRTLLIECDLRRPTLARWLGIDSSRPGLVQILTGEAELYEAAVRVELRSVSARRPTLDVIVSGARSSNPHELLSSTVVAEVIDLCRHDYDFVVLDTSAVSDALPVLVQSDAVLVVARLGTTSRDDLAHLASELRRVDAPLMGVVANGAKSRGRMFRDVPAAEPERAPG